MKRSFGGAVANILQQKCHAGSILIFQTEFLSACYKCPGSPFSRQFFYVARLVACAFGATDGLGIDIRRDDPQTKRGESLREAVSPNNRESIRLFPSGASCAPAADLVFSTRDLPLCEFREDLTFQMLKNASVAIEAGNVNPAQAVQRCPFPRVIFQVASIRFQAWQFQLLHTAVDALVDLAAHFAKTQPAQT